MPREAPPPLLSHGNGPRARRSAPPAGKRRDRPPVAPRAADKSREQCARPEGGPAAGPGIWPRDTKGLACLRRLGAGGASAWGGEKAATRIPATCVRSPERPRDAEGGGGQETKGGSAGSCELRDCAGEWAVARAGLGLPHHPRAGLGAVRGAGGGAAPRDRAPRRAEPSVSRVPLTPSQGALDSCLGNEGGGGVGSEVAAKSVLRPFAGRRGVGEAVRAPGPASAPLGRGSHCGERIHIRTQGPNPRADALDAARPQTPFGAMRDARHVRFFSPGRK